MPVTPHAEKHFLAAAAVRDVVIGMADGLTVPFALAAGLSGAVDSSAIIVTAGLAEIVAGAIAMGLGGYLAARTDLEHYTSERAREERETIETPELEAEEVASVFRRYGLGEEQIAPVVAAVRADRKRWVAFMMRFELGIEEIDPSRAKKSSLTIGGSYAAGGLIPLLPYMLASDVPRALAWSAAVTLLTLLVFGFVKSRFTGAPPWRGAWQTAAVGGLAAGAAFALAKLIG